MTNQSKAEPELIEKIAEEGVRLYAFPNLWNRLNKNEKNNWRAWVENKILPIIKEALPELAKEAGYVRLAEDQSLPKEIDRFKGQVKRVLLQSSWRKVVLEKKDDIPW